MSLQKRLQSGETVLCAEGYLLGAARRGYVGTGVWSPHFILDYPEVLTGMHYEFVHCGSDVVLAMQYYAHREKLRQVGLEHEVERINRNALRLARDVAQKTGKIFAGNICNTNMYEHGNEQVAAEIRAMFDEQTRWAKEEGVDYIVAETYNSLGEAEIALDVIKSYNLPAVIMFSGPLIDMHTFDKVPIGEACKSLLDKGACLVGTNCNLGPEQCLEVVKEIVKLCPPERVCALPLGYRTTSKCPNMFVLRDEDCSDNYKPYPHGLEAFGVAPVEITKFTEKCLELGLKYMGICCGNSGMLTNAMARAMGKNTAVAKYHDPESKGTDPFKYLKKNNE